MAQQLDDDNQGNVLGERVTFVYETDNGVTYNITQDASVGVACGNVLSTNAAPPTLKTSQTRPIRPRYVLLEGQTEPEKRKKVIIGDPANPLVSGAQLTVSINAVTYRVATVRGEGRNRLRVQPPA